METHLIRETAFEVAAAGDALRQERNQADHEQTRAGPVERVLAVLDVFVERYEP